MATPLFESHLVDMKGLVVFLIFILGFGSIGQSQSLNLADGSSAKLPHHYFNKIDAPTIQMEDLKFNYMTNFTTNQPTSINNSKKSKLFFSLSLMLLTSSLVIEDKNWKLGMASGAVASASIGLYFGLKKQK